MRLRNPAEWQRREGGRFVDAQRASINTVPGEVAAPETRTLEKRFSSVIVCLTGLHLEISSKNKGVSVAVCVKLKTKLVPNVIGKRVFRIPTIPVIS